MTMGLMLDIMMKYFPQNILYSQINIIETLNIGHEFYLIHE